MTSGQETDRVHSYNPGAHTGRHDTKHVNVKLCPEYIIQKKYLFYLQRLYFTDASIDNLCTNVWYTLYSNITAAEQCNLPAGSRQGV